MKTERGIKLAGDIRQTVLALKQACQGVDEALASAAPGERWSPKMILSHLQQCEADGSIQQDSLGKALLDFSRQPSITEADVLSEIEVSHAYCRFGR